MPSLLVGLGSDLYSTSSRSNRTMRMYSLPCSRPGLDTISYGTIQSQINRTRCFFKECLNLKLKPRCCSLRLIFLASSANCLLHSHLGRSYRWNFKNSDKSLVPVMASFGLHPSKGSPCLWVAD